MKKAESMEIEFKIEKLLKEGKTYKEIADAVQMKYTNLLQFCYNHDLRMNPSNLWIHKNNSEKIENIKAELRQNQLKQIDIAKKYNVSRQYIHQIKKKMVEENDE